MIIDIVQEPTIIYGKNEREVERYVCECALVKNNKALVEIYTVWEYSRIEE